MDTQQARPRPLTADETGVLAALLAQHFPGVAELRQQAPHALAVPGCGCGCGTISLIVTDPRAPQARTLDSQPAAVDFSAPGEGGVITLIVIDGLLDELRMSYWGEDPTPMPSPEHLTT
ncbi:hypothetical protein [Kineococcus sp. SYSU DK001]|uniref:hypothetical protein n=1 Tax=Kineococcus sp. SYSU DK001 TaxID=3383122 RepID=UPI003D7CC2CF